MSFLSLLLRALAIVPVTAALSGGLASAVDDPEQAMPGKLLLIVGSRTR
jgi:hypothetical protein